MMQITTGPVTTADALRFADELEVAIGEVANGRRKAGKLPVEPMCRLIQFARTSKAELAQVDQSVHRAAFEKWYRDEMCTSACFDRIDGTDFYDETEVQIAWRGYQAALGYSDTLLVANPAI